MSVRRIVWLVCCLFLGMAGIAFVAQDEARAANETGTVVAESGLNIREGAGTSYKVTGKLANGSVVNILETATDSQGNIWYRITALVGESELSGYVSAAYVVKDAATGTQTPASDATAAATATAVPSAAATAAPEATAVTTYRTETTYSNISVKAKTLQKTQVYKKAAGAKKVISKKKVVLSKKKSVKLLGETTVKGQKWFKIQFKWKGKTRTGYVKNTYVQMTASNVPVKIVNVKSKANIRKKAGSSSAYLKNGGKIVKIPKNTTVTVKKDTKYKKKSARWYKISFTYNGKNMKGYIHSKYAKLTKKAVVKKIAITSMTDTEFENSMKEQGFPEDYKASLRALHKSYPFWQFRAYKTGVKWEDAVAAEGKLGVNLISNSKSVAWKSTEEGAYDATTGKWKVFDGSTWVAASSMAISYYMDPRNFLNERNIFQFELLEYQDQYQTTAGINSILNNTPFNGKSFSFIDATSGNSRTISYTDTFVEAAKASGVSPYHLASRVKQEVVTSATTTSSAVSGDHSTYPGIYNFYNIGATSGSNPVANGLKWASSGTTYRRPWTDPYRSIVGGAEYIGTSYINKGQNTLYLQKFNVTPNSRYDHQYMTNVEAAYSEAIKTKTAYGDVMKTTPLVFSIPVYDEMPQTASTVPN